MTGHEPIIGLRRAGRLPKAGMVWAKTDGTAYRHWHQFGDHAEVGIEAGDYPDLLDLRFASGLTVIVEGTDADRVASVGKAFERAKAKRVIETLNTGGMWCETASVADTLGVLTWPR